MNALLDKLILFLCCVGLAMHYFPTEFFVVPMLTSLTFISLTGYFNEKIISFCFYVLFILLSMQSFSFLFFMPLAAYDAIDSQPKYIYILTLIPAVFYHNLLTLPLFFLIFTFLFISSLLRNRTKRLSALRRNYLELRDEASDLTDRLKRKNKELLEAQDYEINLATLNERNRIAREIHDNIGHILSRVILQVGALLAITKEPVLKENLENVKDSLNSGMNSIRNSIHNIHEDSLDLYARLKGLVNDFDFCSAHLDYSISTEMPMKAKYSILFIVKEALSNVIKHSNATQVTISLIERPGFFQLIIMDNGTQIRSSSSDGMGTNSMLERISTLGGIMNIETSRGYHIYITLPKESG